MTKTDCRLQEPCALTWHQASQKQPSVRRLVQDAKGLGLRETTRCLAIPVLGRGARDFLRGWRARGSLGGLMEAPQSGPEVVLPSAEPLTLAGGRRAAVQSSCHPGCQRSTQPEPVRRPRLGTEREGSPRLGTALRTQPHTLQAAALRVVGSHAGPVSPSDVPGLPTLSGPCSSRGAEGIPRPPRRNCVCSGLPWERTGKTPELSGPDAVKEAASAFASAGNCAIIKPSSFRCRSFRN